MNKIPSLAAFAMGAVLMSASALCQTQTDSPKAKASDGLISKEQLEQVVAQATPPAVPVEDQATKEQLARLIEVMRVRQAMEPTAKMMVTRVQQQIQAKAKEVTAKLPGGSSPTPELQAAIDKVVNQYMGKAAEIYPVEEMVHDMTAAYQRHIARSDVEAIIEFYASTAGQHLLDEQPAIARESMAIAIAKMERNEESKIELTDAMAREIERAIKSSTSTGGKP